jgi:hypothetical protein
MLLTALSACGGALQRGAPLPDTDEMAERLINMTGVSQPTHVVFEWEYVDGRGRLRGDGSARINPPDLFRLDLFSTGEGSIAAVLVDGILSTQGDLQDIILPDSPFLYAMTGLFRPGSPSPLGGFKADDLEVLEYLGGKGAHRYFYLSKNRLMRVEDKKDGHFDRGLEITWTNDPSWPGEVRYRDVVGENRVRWKLVRSSMQSKPFEPSIYDLPKNP